MLNISENADAMIRKFFQDKEGDHVIRIYLVQGG
jgi:Fe-S cluster assembly iron-binding protein IscA